jgi:hypothetical protein
VAIVSWDFIQRRQRAVEFMPKFTLPLGSSDPGWIELRERLARLASEMHFCAVSNEALNGARLLAIAGNLAGLALSIPMYPTQTTSGGLVDALTLIATQVLQNDQHTSGGTFISEKR